MKIIIDDTICEAKGLSLSKLFFLLFIKSSSNPTEDITSLLAEQKLILTPVNTYAITPKWDDETSDILLSSEEEKVIPSEKALTELAIKLMAIMPEGKMPGTPYYYKCNKREIVLKLKKFYKLYGKYTDEQILEATKRYVQSFNGTYTYLKLLKYFILKGEDSQLATLLENKDVIIKDNSKMSWD